MKNPVRHVIVKVIAAYLAWMAVLVGGPSFVCAMVGGWLGDVAWFVTFFALLAAQWMFGDQVLDWVTGSRRPKHQQWTEDML